METALYVHCAMDVWNGPKMCPVIVGFPLTKTSASLFVFVMSDNEIWGIPVIEDVSPSNEALLCTVYVAVQYLCRNAIVNDQPLVDPLPFENEPLEAFIAGRQPLKTRKDSPEVVKLFDTKDERFLPNVSLMKLCGLNPTKTALSSDERLVQIRYPFIPGHHYPTHLQQFAGVTGMLYKLHEEGYVHGDVRPKNIVFTDKDSFLIDFDLARKQGEVYPVGFRHFRDIRHPHARENRTMEKEHDRYSLQRIMEKFFPTPVLDEVAQSIICKVEDLSISLDIIEVELRDLTV